MRYWLALLLLLYPVTVCADAGFVGELSQTPADGITYLVDVDFEGTGLPPGWTTGGGTPDYDSTVVVLAGSQSMEADWNDIALTNDFNISSGTVYFKAKFQFDASTNTNVTYFFVFKDSGDNTVLWVALNVDNTLEAKVTTSQASTSSTYSDDTEYTIWIDYTPGTGANAVVNIYTATGSDPAKPGSAEIGITDGESTAYPEYAKVQSTGTNPGGMVYFDNVQVANEGI